nr:reverse transcriptase domain-containing protein [Tanacetum cinerariifolium]
MLSIGGRVTLVSSVLGPLGTYYLSLFPMPITVCKKLKSIRARFLWGSDGSTKKLHWIAWNSVTASKRNGGLGTNASHVAELYNKLADFSLNDSEDVWSWSLGAVSFSVKSTREHIDLSFLPSGADPRTRAPAITARLADRRGRNEPNVWDDEPVDVKPFSGKKHRYVNRLYQPRCNDHVVDRDDRYRDDPIRSLGLKIEIPEFTGKVINEFDKLRMRCDVVEEEEQVVVRFLGVLKPEIADIVSFQPYWTYTNVCKLTFKVEKQIKAKSKGSTSRFTPPSRTAPFTAPKATTLTTLVAGNTRERVDNAPRCYKYGGLEHNARDCLNVKTLAFVPDDACLIYDNDAEPEVDEPCDELIYPDRGEALVIQRVLNVEQRREVKSTVLATATDSTLQVVEIRVPNLNCQGYASKLKKAIFKLK